MEEYDLYQSYVGKLKDFCKSSGLRFTLECGSYPVTLTLRPGDFYRQMSLLEENPEEPTDAAMIFTFSDGEVRFTTLGGFVINDATFSKVKGLFQKIVGFWTQYVFHRLAIVPDDRFRALWDRAKADAEDSP